ncbi:MAG: TonB-dependent receptor [Flavobacteriaceae bacterium]|nr:TonB-dependent receptor [Flavobacteriaceae bacterium]
MKYIYTFLIIIFYSINSFSQNDTINLKEVLVTATNRIDLPFNENSRTINIISSIQIKESNATNVADLLQHFSGIDVRKRGVEGMQSDLYIRGGGFDQTLVLIDGVKMDDSQTGHHSMNAMISLSNIERIEIIKGPAARIYGQNAFTGAINIVTKKPSKSGMSFNLSRGSYDNNSIGLGLAKVDKNSAFQFYVDKQESEGYRFNTDFDNFGLYLKGTVGKYEFLSYFNERKFGANGFYASPNFKDQYEETQTSLVSLSTKIITDNFKITPRIYWRRNQDMYLFLRHNPSYYRNLHISNKLGAEVNMSYNSVYGKTGFGVDANKVFLESNNLGAHNRTVLTSFLEHRFELLDAKLDITPGVAVSYYDDFGTKAFPGIDVGYQLTDKIRTYANVGYTYRIPTYTDLYYKSSIEQGNPDLKPESALSEEIGLNYLHKNINFNLAFFNRNSDNLIDWTKDNVTDKWQARNFSEVTTRGLETSVSYKFNLMNFNQNFELGYTYIDDTIKDLNVAFTRYSINSMKHQFTTQLNTQFLSFLKQSIAYRFVERTHGETYGIVDAKLIVSIKKLDFYVNINNIFDEVYTETNLVPMPKSNFMFGIKFQQ